MPSSCINLLHFMFNKEIWLITTSSKVLTIDPVKTTVIDEGFKFSPSFIKLEGAWNTERALCTTITTHWFCSFLGNIE